MVFHRIAEELLDAVKAIFYVIVLLISIYINLLAEIVGKNRFLLHFRKTLEVKKCFTNLLKKLNNRAK